jgi:hypothetical protein
VARNRWLSIEVELLSGRDVVLDHPAGRVMIASPSHTLAELAEAIDVAFARWDRSHLQDSSSVTGSDKPVAVDDIAFVKTDAFPKFSRK